MQPTAYRRFSRALPWLGVLVLLWMAGAVFAQDVTDPPARVALLSAREGSVVFAPQGDDEWVELRQNRPLTPGDRLWSDRGSRAELQLGSATLHVDSETHLGVSDLDERVAHFMLQQGTVNARVRELLQGENFEIGTPNIALRALQPGDYRIDVDAETQRTRVVVHSGLAAIYGDGGRSIQMGAGQQATFAGRSLAQVDSQPFRQDAFGAWAAERNRLEDQSIAARYLPRGVVGYSQLDPYGTWAQDPTYGTVWYPHILVQNWAPYRYGHWEWIAPWGWTWIDDAPWGFAPFHYGRWAMVGSRWCWVPGPLAARPVYAPALVVFLGGGGLQFSASIGSGPAVGWYPLAPGEAWWPVYRASPRYVSYANHRIDLNAYPRNYTQHLWRTRPFAATAVREDDFRRGRPVGRQWQPLQPQVIGQAQVGVVPMRPERRSEREALGAPRVHGGPPSVMQPGVEPPRFSGTPPAVREQFRAQREQDRLQRDAERAAREQMRQQEQVRQQQDVRQQREQIYRQQQEQAGRIQQERAQREAWQRQREQEQAGRMQQERVQREALQRQREQERQVRPPEPRVMPQQVQPVTQQPPQPQAAPLQRGQRHEARPEGRGHEPRGEARGQRDGDDDRRGRGQGNR
jgi:hypothetical protein